MEIYYVNHKNQKIDLGHPPYQMQIGDIFNHTNKYEGSGNKIKRIYKEISTIPTVVTIEETEKISFAEAVNHFFDVTEADVTANVQGRLYIGEYYLLCNVISSDKTFWKETYTGMENAIKLLTPYPFWCHELNKTFMKGNSVTETGVKTGKLSYPYRYPYRYSIPQDVGFIINDHYAACDFKMIIYGPCTNPSIMINGHLYEVKATLYTGEYIVIDSRTNTVIRYLDDGRTVNLFNWRNKDNNLFEKIPSGHCSVLWNTDAFGFDIVLFQERSEPKWTL